MSAKVPASDFIVERKRKMRRRITLELKIEVLRRIEGGERQAEVSRYFGIPESSIRTIWKNADAVRTRAIFAPSLLAKQLTRFRSNLVERMEVMLSEWIDEQPDSNIPLSIVMGRARSIYNYLQQEAGPESAKETFCASRGWYHRFKRRMSLRVMNDGTTNIHSRSENYIYPPVECKINTSQEYSGNEEDEDNALNEQEAPDEDNLDENDESENNDDQEMTIDVKESNIYDNIPEEHLKPEPVEQTKTVAQVILNEALNKINEALELFEKNDPDWSRSAEVKENVLNNVSCYSLMLRDNKTS